MTAPDLTVTRRQHLRHAALLWALAGAVLCVRGLIWVIGDPHTHRWLYLLLPLAAALGLLKSAAVLRPAARRAAARIHALAERSPVWTLFSPATYLLIAAMIAFGLFARWAGVHFHLTGPFGAVYLVVGVGLLVGSRWYGQGDACAPSGRT